MCIDPITAYSLRHHSCALYLPSKRTLRRLLYETAGVLERLEAANLNLVRANDALARELTDWVRDAATASAAIERLTAENAALEAELRDCRVAVRRLAQAVAEGE